MTPLHVAILWHQHQPLYRNPRTGRYALPWVRLHALKDYYDMAALAGDFPDLRLTFNLVPSLLDQIDDYAAGTAVDPALELARRPASDLDEAARVRLLDLFFSAPYRTMIVPYPRYAALWHKRGRPRPGDGWRDALPRFSVADLRDLQVWFHLAWCGQALRRRPEIRGLFRKGDGFTEQDKQALLAIQHEFLGGVLAAHARLRDAGIAELSVSPYYHPILPLLCDLESAREAVPGLPLPQAPFRHPADAAWQVGAALDASAARFGARASGMWPSEGSLSEEVVRMLGDHGVRWAASDEQVLRASLGDQGGDPAVHCAPWRLESAGEGGPAIFFRDTRLSDLIGFTYANWRPDRAADDFLGRLRAVGRLAPGGVVSIILDGENAWEHYPDNGEAFLRALYGRLVSADDIRTVTFSGALEALPPPHRLPRLRAGSWIGADFTTWIGHPEKNRVWEILSGARGAVAQRLEASPEIRRTLAAAEGSDWFWWMGDDHSSDQDAIFDASFRDLARRLYDLAGAAPPADLDRPIKRHRAIAWTRPTGRVAADLDGRVTDYFEWLGAGVCEGSAGMGAMQEAAGHVGRVAYGTDGASLYVRIDPARGDIEALLGAVAGAVLTIVVESPRPATVSFRLGASGVAREGGEARFAAGRVLEAAVPLPAPGPVAFHVALVAAGGTVQRLPREGAIAFAPDEPPDWSV